MDPSTSENLDEVPEDLFYTTTQLEDNTIRRVLCAGTLPAILRTLTSIESTTQFDIWALLLHIRQYSTATYIISFLQDRYLLTVEKANQISAELSSELDGNATETGKDDSTRRIQSMMNRHLLGKKLFRNAALHSDGASVDSSQGLRALEEHEAESTFFIDIKLGVLLLLETWLSNFPEDFMAAPREHVPEGVETEPKDDWHQRPSVYDGNEPELFLAGDTADEPMDSMDLLIHFIKTAMLPCPFLLLLGVDFLHNCPDGLPKELGESTPFEASFPCLFKIVKFVARDVRGVASSRCDPIDSSTVIKSDRGDGYDKSIIPLAIVICSINARSRLRRISQADMSKLYFREHDPILLTCKSDQSASEPIDSKYYEPFDTGEEIGRYSLRRKTNDYGELKDFLPWYQSEQHQFGELRTRVTQVLGLQYMNCMSKIMEQYHGLVAVLRAAEMGAAEDDDMFFDSIPIKVFVTPIDKQILTYKYSKTKGFLGVANSMQVLRHNFAEDDDTKAKANTIGVILSEAMRGYDSCGNSDDDHGDDGSPHRGVTNSPIDEQSSEVSFGSFSRRKRVDEESHLTSKRGAAIVVNEELGRELQLQAIEEKRTLILPYQLFRRRRKRKELERKLQKWKEEHHVPSGIDSARGTTDVLKAHIVRSLSTTCKNSLLFMYSPSLLAYNLTLKLHYLYCTIPLQEFAVHCGFSSRSRQEVPLLARFREECDRMQELFVNEILLETDAMSRATLIMNLIQLGEAAAGLWSHHLLMLIVQVLQSHCIYHLKHTWKIVDSAMPGAWKRLQDRTGFSGSTLLAMQMDKFEKFGLTDDIRKNIYVYSTDYLKASLFVDRLQSDRSCSGRVLDEHSSTNGHYIDNLTQCLENSLARAANNSELLTSAEVSIGKTASASSDSLSYLNSVKFDRAQLRESFLFVAHDIFASDKLYLRCAFRQHGHVSDFQHQKESQPRLTSSSIGSFAQIIDDDIAHFAPNATALSIDSSGVHHLTLEDDESGNPVFADERVHEPECFAIGDAKDKKSDVIEKSPENSIRLSEFHCQDDLKIRADEEKLPSCSSLNRNPECKPIAAGIVRDDKAADLKGLPKLTPGASMPYVQGILSKLIRLSDLPEYMRDIKDPDSSLFMLSPGICIDDQLLPMINFGKLRSVARWMLLLRCTQLTPYRYDAKAVLTDLHMKLLKPPMFKGQDAQWERSLLLEKDT